MENERNRSANWIWTVFLGLLAMLGSYIWLIYDPSRITLVSPIAIGGMIVAIFGVWWTPRPSVNR